MNGKDAVRMLGGSVAIYVVVAACSGTGDGASTRYAPGNDAAQGGEDAATVHDGSIQHLLDALTDPVAEASADINQSGSRLKVQTWVGLDGSSLAAGMYDSQLKTQCSFAVASDGSMRCLPFSGAVIASIGLFYADSGCSVPLAVGGAGCAIPSYVYTGTNTCGTTAYTFSSISGSFAGTVYEGSPSSCTAVPASSLASDTLYSVGAELPPSTFVQATLTTGS
jgi:hypothetical protein